MQTSDDGVHLIQTYEGILDGNKATPNLDPYLCPADYWTIGWGHVVLDEDGTMLKGRQNRDLAYSYFPGGITMEQAEVLLRSDLVKFEKHVVRALNGAPCTQQEFDAFVSLCFNIGPGNFAKSSVLRYHIAGQNYPADNNEDRLDQIIASGRADNAADAFLLWTKAGGRVLPGLVKRRKDERFLYMYGPL